jgi:hypothetical protein
MVMNSVNGIKGLKSAIGDGKINFYPDLERIDKAQLLACNFVIMDAKLVSDWDSEYGTTSFFLVKVKPVSKDFDKEMTTILGGLQINKVLRKCVDGRKFPVSASLNIKKAEKGNEYWVLDDPDPAKSPEPF